MTGRGRGLCNIPRPEVATRSMDRAGFGRGLGLGRGFRCGFGPDMRGFMGRGLGRGRAAFPGANAEDARGKIDLLKAQSESLKRALEAVNQRLSEMEKSA